VISWFVPATVVGLKAHTHTHEHIHVHVHAHAQTFYTHVTYTRSLVPPPQQPNFNRLASAIMKLRHSASFCGNVEARYDEEKSKHEQHTAACCGCCRVRPQARWVGERDPEGGMMWDDVWWWW
jgi:hypothetical protein